MTKEELDRKYETLRSNMLRGTPLEKFSEAFVEYTRAAAEFIWERTEGAAQS